MVIDAFMYLCHSWKTRCTLLLAASRWSNIFDVLAPIPNARRALYIASGSKQNKRGTGSLDLVAAVTRLPCLTRHAPILPTGDLSSEDRGTDLSINQRETTGDAASVFRNGLFLPLLFSPLSLCFFPSVLGGTGGRSSACVTLDWFTHLYASVAAAGIYWNGLINRIWNKFVFFAFWRSRDVDEQILHRV